MKGAEFFRIGVTLFVLTVFFSILFLSSAYAQGIDNLPHAMGLIFMTPEERAAFQQTHGRVLGFRLSNIGLERVNEVRADLNLPQLPEASAVPFGEDVISTVGGGGSGVGISEYGDSLPFWVDNSLLPAFPPIRSQAAQGSCTCFATAYYQYTYTAGLIYGWDHTGTLRKDWQFSPKWNYNMANGGMNEGSRFDYNYFILERYGGARWSDFAYYFDPDDPAVKPPAYPTLYDKDYREWCTTTSVWESAISDRTNEVGFIPIDDVTPEPGLQEIKEALNNGHIVTFGSRFSCWRYTTIQDNPSTTRDNEFNDDPTKYPVFGKPVAFWLRGDSTSGHAITIVGYNDDLWTDVNGNGEVDDGELGALRIANSWGTWWNPMSGNNDRGFTWLAYDALKAKSSIPGAPKARRIQGAITTQQVFLLTLRSTPGVYYNPKMVAEFEVSHINRDQLWINLGISDAGGSAPSSYLFPPAEEAFIALRGGGGPYGFGGEAVTNPEDSRAAFVFDFTDLLPTEAGSERYYLVMEDSASGGGSAALYRFEIRDMYGGGEDQSYNPPMTVDGGLVYASLDTSPPEQVAGLNVSPVSCVQLDLTWAANGEEDLDHYNVYRSIVQGGDPTGVYDFVAQVQKPTVLYSDTGLTPSTTYYYVVAAVDTSGNEGQKSAEAPGTTYADDDLGPVTTNVAVAPNPTGGATSVTLTAEVSDSTVGNSNIAEAEYSVDGGSGTPMNALDGAFDSPTEAVTVSVDVSGLAVGEHTLCVRGRDTMGNWGTTEPVVLNVTEAPGDNIMYVESITFSSKVAGPNKFLYTTVKVVDGDGNPLGGVTVEITLDWDEGKDSWNFSGGTGTDGTIKFTLSKASAGYYTATVTNLISTGGYTWYEAQGETSASCEFQGDGTVIQGVASTLVGFKLLQNNPNPCNPETWIPYALPKPEHVIIKIYNVNGRLVRTLDLGQKAPGAYLSKEKAAYWNGRNESGEQMASGIYFYLMEAGSFRAMKKFVIAK